MINQKYYFLAAVLSVAGIAVAEEAKPKLEAAGVLTPFRRLKVPTRASGILEMNAVEEGAVVKKDDLLAKFDNRAEQYEVDHQAAVKKLWEIKAAQLKTLVEAKAESQDKLNEALANAEVSAADLKRTQKQLDDKTILAPMAGIITRRFHLPGEWVQQDRDSDLFELVDIEHLYFYAYFDAKDYLRVQNTQNATVTLQVTQKSFVGKVDFVDPIVDAGSGQFRVRVLLENPAHEIIAGLKGSVVIEENPGNVAVAR